jgi:midasin (ATPase involved in ribosome maturation)
MVTVPNDILRFSSVPQVRDGIGSTMLWMKTQLFWDLTPFACVITDVTEGVAASIVRVVTKSCVGEMVVLLKQRAGYSHSLLTPIIEKFGQRNLLLLNHPEKVRNNILRNISSYQATWYRIPKGFQAPTRFASVLIATCLQKHAACRSALTFRCLTNKLLLPRPFIF